MFFLHLYFYFFFFFFFSSRRRHTRCSRDWSSDVCSSDLQASAGPNIAGQVTTVPLIRISLDVSNMDMLWWPSAGATKKAVAASPAIAAGRRLMAEPPGSYSRGMISRKAATLGEG